MSRVVVVGSANVDIITRVGHLPLPGETLLGTDAAFRPGGKGANQAIAASRLGASTTLYAAVGADDFGRQVRAALAVAGVQIASVTDVAGETTGVAMIVVAADGENTIVVAPGANRTLGPAAVADLPTGLAPGDLLALQLEVPLHTCLAAAAAARTAGARVQLNAAPLPTPGDPTFRALLAAVDVLVINETEALALASRGPTGVGEPAGWLALADELRRLGPRAVVITLGGAGAVAHDGSEPVIQPAFAAAVVDTTGAGDAFCGALATALAEGQPLPAAIRFGCGAGALACGQLGAQAALPARDQLDELLRGTL